LEEELDQLLIPTFDNLDLNIFERAIPTSNQLNKKHDLIYVVFQCYDNIYSLQYDRSMFGLWTKNSKKKERKRMKQKYKVHSG